MRFSQLDSLQILRVSLNFTIILSYNEIGAGKPSPRLRLKGEVYPRKTMKFSKFHYICLVIIAISFGVAAYFYPHLPENLASHWGANGEVNGWMPKIWGLFLMPVLSAIFFVVFLFVPKMDPKWKNIKKFENYFNGFIVIFFLFLFYLFLLTIFWNLNFRFNIIQLLSPAFAILFFCAGVLIEHTSPNYTIGIRTPWAIENPKNWEKTHELGGKLFKLAGVIAFFGVLLPEFAIWIVIAPIIFFSIYVMLYSYLLYQKHL